MISIGEKEGTENDPKGSENQNNEINDIKFISNFESHHHYCLYFQISKTKQPNPADWNKNKNIIILNNLWIGQKEKNELMIKLLTV